MTIPTAEDRLRIVRLCSIFGAAGWVVSEIMYELMLGPHVQLLRSLMVGAGVGALVGLLAASMQWVVLQRYVRGAAWWIAATTAGYTLAGIISSFVIYQAITSTELFRTTLPLQGAVGSAVAGLVLGLTQWLVLREWVEPELGWRSWIVPVSVGTALAAPIAWLAGAGMLALLTWAVGRGAWPMIVVAGYLAAGVAGGIVYGRFLALGFRRTLPEPVQAETAASADQ